jgi:putative redox protein
MTPSITVSFPGGQRVDARVGDHVVHTDQPVSGGGSDTAPDPFSLFLASLASCAGFYVQAFCATRRISTRDITLTQQHIFDDQKRLADVVLELGLPADFPERYVEGIRAAAASCKVKKVLASPPNVVVRVTYDARAAANASLDVTAAPRQPGGLNG